MYVFKKKRKKEVIIGNWYSKFMCLYKYGVDNIIFRIYNFIEWNASCKLFLF